MASYSVSTSWATVIYGRDYNAVTITDSDGETYAAEERVQVVVGDTILYAGSFIGWVGGTTLTIDLSAVLRYAARMYPWQSAQVTISGAYSGGTTAPLVDGSAYAETPLLTRYWVDADLGSTLIPMPWGVGAYQLVARGEAYHTDRVSGVEWEVTEADAGTTSYWLLDDGSKQTVSILDWQTYHPCEEPIYIKWTGAFGFAKSWVWTRGGETHEPLTAITLSVAGDGRKRVSGRARTVRVIERGADRDTRLWLGDLAVADDAEMVVRMQSGSDWEYVSIPVYVEDAAEVNLSETQADIEMTVAVQEIAI